MAKNGNGKTKRIRINSFRPQSRNANKHTQAGLTALDDSIRRDGWIGAMTVAADGETFDGSARLERIADIMPDVEPVVIESDGTRPVIIKRTDIPGADDPRAKRLGVAANVITRIDYDPDAEILAKIAAEDDTVRRLVEQDAKSLRAILGNEQYGTGSGDIPEQWLILIECDAEIEQTKLIQKFCAEGLRCRALIS